MNELEKIKEQWIQARLLRQAPVTITEACDLIITLVSRIEEAQKDLDRARSDLEHAHRSAGQKMRMFADEVSDLARKWE